ncbi:MAG: sialate O-acetylesterase [Bacteroidales bacterium]|nr:sialate O-acetylesterase [Bacteroidales bacterium]
MCKALSFRYMTRFLASLAATMLPAMALANVSLPAVISDGMVLEQNSKVKLWGWAKPYEVVSITTSWDTTTYKVNPTPLAQWSVEIPTPAATDKPQSITFRGYNEVTVSDILIGEVILCAGQSNMEFSPSWGMIGGDSLVAQATQPDIRMFRVDYRTSATPCHNVSGVWQHTTPQAANNFSAIGYIIACRLREVLGCPVGIVDASWGGTPVETWTPAECFADPELKALNDKLSDVSWGPVRPGLGYNAMVAPLMNYKFRAVAWYQGEQNCENASGYSRLLQTLVSAWRKELYNGADIPFIFAQIAPYKYDSPGLAVEVRDQQRIAAGLIPNSGLVVIGELADLKDIHPKRKIEAGDRFANAVLTEAYGKTGFDYKAPLLQEASLNAKGNAAIVKFANAEGLHITGKSRVADWFELAGDDGVFHPAVGKIQKDGSVIVMSKLVRQPKAVRYAWADDAWPNLAGKNGIQASCFGAQQLKKCQ